MGQTPTPLAPEELLSRADWLRLLASRIVRDEAEVEDLVHDTWLAALRRPGREVRHLGSWLATVVQNLSLRRLRQSARQEELDPLSELSLEDGQPGPVEHLDQASVRETVVEAVLALPEPFRQTVLETYFEGLAAPEIAHRHGIPCATVRTRLHRAHERLRGSLSTGSHRRAIWAGLLLLARRPAPALVPLPPGPGLGLGPAGALAAAAGLAGLVLLAARGLPGADAGAQLSPADRGRALALDELIPADPAGAQDSGAGLELQLEEVGRAGHGAGHEDEHGPGCGGGLEGLVDRLAPLLGGGGMPQPSWASDPNAGTAAGRGQPSSSRRAEQPLAELSPDLVEGWGPAALLPAAAATPAGPSGGPSASAPAPRAHFGGVILVPPPLKDEDEDEKDYAGDLGGVGAGLEPTPDQAGATQGGPVGAGFPNVATELKSLDQLLQLCPCLERIGPDRWLAVQALVEAGRLDLRTLPDPCALCDASPRAALVARVPGGLALVAVPTAPGPARAALPFDDLVVLTTRSASAR